MAAGEYVSVSSQADSERADIARERRELQDDPASELEELAGIYGKRGLDADLAHRVAEQLTERDALGAHERDELGNIAGNNGEARSSRARVGGLVRDRRRIAASAGDRGAGSNAGRQSASRAYCFWHSSGRSRQKRAAHRYSRRPSALRSGRLWRWRRRPESAWRSGNGSKYRVRHVAIDGERPPAERMAERKVCPAFMFVRIL